MRDILDVLRQQYIQKGYDMSEVDFTYDAAIPTEEKLQYEILKQRYTNIKTLLAQQSKVLVDLDTEELQNILFFYNPLQELEFVGPDVYANVIMFRNKVPRLYKRVQELDVDFKKSSREADNRRQMKTMLELSYGQSVQSLYPGMYSYSKCLGVVLRKYIDVHQLSSTKSIEVRKDVNINAVRDSAGGVKSLHKYWLDNLKSEGVGTLPQFSVDLSYVYKGKQNLLKSWLYKHGIRQVGDTRMSTVLDACVECNFTNKEPDSSTVLCEDVERIEFSGYELCSLVYTYFRTYVCNFGHSSMFRDRLKRSIAGVTNSTGWGDLDVGAIMCVDYSRVDYTKINKFLEDVDWELERKYLATRGGNVEKQFGTVEERGAFMDGEVESITRKWINCVFDAVVYACEYAKVKEDN